LVIEKREPLNFMQQVSDSKTAELEPAKRVPEQRYAYYRRCQVFRRNGEQCKAPAEKGAHICYAHAGQLAMAVRRERERRAVLAEAVAEMRKRGRPECEVADLFTDFKGIQVTLAVMSRAAIDGRIDCKTAGRLVVHLQTLSKLLWMVHRRKTSTTESRRHREYPKLPQICADELGSSKPDEMMPLPVVVPKNVSPESAPACGGAKVLPFEVTAFADRSRAHGPPGWKAA
jgi:hypothetical protein